MSEYGYTKIPGRYFIEVWLASVYKGQHGLERIVPLYTDAKKVYADVKIQMHKECAKGLEMNETVENSVKKICKNVLRYIQEYTEEFLFIEQSCNSPFATEEVLNEIEQHSKEIVGIFERGIKEGVLKQTSPILLISFCYYPIQQIFKEYRKPNSMLPDTDFNMVFQMCWDAIKR